MVLTSMGLNCQEDVELDETSRLEWLDLVDVVNTYRREGEIADFVHGHSKLTIFPREILFLTGGNGSGKTTLAKLLTGLYVPAGGEILLNGKPITDENRELYRQHFSVVFSDSHLF